MTGNSIIGTFRFNRLGLFVYACVISGIIVPACVITVLVYHFVAGKFADETQSYLNTQSARVLNGVETYIANIKTGLGVLSTHPDIVSWLSQIETISKTEKNELAGKLTPFKHVYGFDNLYLFDGKGKELFSLIAHTDETPPIRPLTPVSGGNDLAAAFQLSLESGKAGFTSAGPCAWYQTDTCYFITQAIVNRSGKTPGVIVMELSSTTISTLIGNAVISGDDTNHYVASKEKNLIGGSPLKTPGTGGNWASPGIKNALDDAKHTQAPVMFRETAPPLLGVVSRIPFPDGSGPEWFLISEIKADRFSPVLHELKSSAFLYLIVAGIVAIGFALYQHRKIVAPVTQIAGWATQAAKGNIVPVPPVDTPNEIGVLVNNIGLFSSNTIEFLDSFKAMSKGDFSLKYEKKGPADLFAEAVEGIVGYFEKIHYLVGEIARGNYTVTVTHDSEKDLLGPELLKMSRALNSMNEENFRQISTTFAQMELMRQISGEHEPVSITEQLLVFLCHYFDAQTGVFYFKEGDSPDLKLSGSYGCIRDLLQDRIKPGEGLAGQALVEKKHFLIKGCPEEFFKVTSGLAELLPTNLLVYPFLFRGDVVAILEIGSLTPFGSDTIGFLSKNSESISIALNSALARNRMAELLKQTLEQSGILEAQQAELKKANIDLASQTEALKLSEQNLREREEELKIANTELEAYSHSLENQKEALEEAKNSIETKALELELSNRYKSEFLANMSHELRTPLNSIILLSKLLSENKEGHMSSKHQEFAAIINNSGNELLNLINEILDLSRVKTGKMVLSLSSHPVDDTMKKLSRMFKSKAKDLGLNFTISKAPGIPDTLYTDHHKLEQILKNFLTNAFKFTRRGSISLTIGRPGDHVDLSQSGLPRETSLEFTVKDTGAGIPEDKQKLIFESFKQADGSISRIHGGTGLGLSIAREFAYLLGGEIHLKSRENRGSTFFLYIPEHSAEATVKDNGESEVVVQTRKQ